MSDSDSWQESNARQLAAALQALRQRLERYVEQTTAPSPEPDMPAAEERPPEQHLSALTLLSQRLGLSPFEKEILLLAAAMELDTRIAELCARAHADANKPFPTFALAMVLFDDPSWDVLSPERPLRYWRLLEINQRGAQPLTASALRADERIVNYIKGLNYLDDRVASFLTELDVKAETAELAPSQSAIVENVTRRWQNQHEGPLPVLQMLGSDGISKQLVALGIARELNCHLCRLPLDLLPSAPADLENLARLWQRESRLLPLALFVDAEEADAAATGRNGACNRFVARAAGLCFLSVREAVPRLGRDHLTVDVRRPTPAEQRSAWAEELGSAALDSPVRLASQFNFDLPNLRALARRAVAESANRPETLPDKVWDICRESERPRLDALAQRLEPKMRWEDLVLPRAEEVLLREIAAQVAQRNKVYGDWGFDRKMNRGFGISALFAGESGCGKTMAAEVIANDLRLNLYRIDLSAVVNKYIGETEKNLRRLFDAAEDGGSILFFDEADALFGKRSEVKDSHDRYANIEINYLLQRLESYGGIVILATNMKSALDNAFVRRLRFIVNFPFPGVADRKRLWEKVFLQEEAAEHRPAPPLESLDYDRLARFNLSGGHIHNVALNACFMAAHANTKVTMPLVLEAARAEFLKLDRPINELDFRWTAAANSKPNGAARPQDLIRA